MIIYTVMELFLNCNILMLFLGFLIFLILKNVNPVLMVFEWTEMLHINLVLISCFLNAAQFQNNPEDILIFLY